MKTKRIDSIQILRALAFLEIFLGHCGVEYGSGSFGVSIFMILSGFCMAINYLPKAKSSSGGTQNLSPLACIQNGISKVKKLYALHLIMLAVTYVVVGMPTSGKAMGRLVADILLVKCWRPHSEDYYSYNGVAWYLSTYMFLCMLAPYVLYLVSKVRKKSQAVGWGIGIYGLMAAIGYYVSVVTIPIGDGFAKWLTYLCPFYRVLDLSIGALLGWIYLYGGIAEDEKTGKWHLLEVLTLLGVIVFELAYPEFKANYMGLGYTAYWVPVSVLLVLVFAKNTGFITKMLHCRPLLWLGNISSLTFLIHQIVIRALKMHIHREMLGGWYLPVIILLSGAITLAGAQGYLWVERKWKEVRRG
jgi:peptidoglycan/LPS O-acetylase OafA/YrhL